MDAPRGGLKSHRGRSRRSQVFCREGLEKKESSKARAGGTDSSSFMYCDFLFFSWNCRRNNSSMPARGTNRTKKLLPVRVSIRINKTPAFRFKARALSEPLARSSLTKGRSSARMLGTPSPRETHALTAERTARQAGAAPWCLSAFPFYIDREGG